jgi:hypothetical protein
MSLRALSPALVCALVWTATVTPAAAQATATPLVEPPVVTAFELVGTTPPPPVVLPLTRRAGVSALHAHVVRVSVGDQARPALIGAITAKVDALDDLRLDALASPLWQVGTYTVVVELAGSLTADGKATAARQELALTLVRPAPRLRTIAPIVIHDQRWGFWRDASVHRRIRLAEQSRVTGVGHLVIEQIDRATHGGAQIDARFEPTRGIHAVPSTLDPGASLDVDLWGVGFPTGTTTGQLTISGDELTTPIVVGYEVRARVVSFYIVPLFLIGGLLGWLVRHKLRQAEAWRTVELQLATLTEAVARELATTPIIERRKALEGAHAALTAALAARDLAKVGTATTELQAKLDEARTARANFINERLTRIAAVRAAIAKQWDLPAPLAPELLAQIDACEQALLDDRPGDGDRLLTTILAAVDPVGGAGNSWRLQAQQALVGYQDDAAGLVPATARAVATQEVAAATAAVAAMPSYQPAARPDLATYLTAVDAARRAVRALADNLRLALEGEATSVGAALAATGAAVDVINRVAQLRQRLHASDPAQALASLGGALRDLASTVTELLSKPEAKALAAAGRYAAAIRREHADRAPEDDHADGLPLSFELAAGARAARATDVRGGLAMRVVTRPGDPIHLAAIRLQRIQAIRGVLVAFVLALLAWVALRGDWTGTLGDALKVLAIAFFTDFTLDALIEAVTRLKPPAPPAAAPPA